MHECLDIIPELERARPMTLRDSLGCARLALWDEAARKLISFRDAARLTADPA